MTDRFAFVAYESPYARCGGVAAVMAYLPAAARKVADRWTCTFTPYHYRIARTTELKLDTIGRVDVPFAGDNVAVTLRRLEQDADGRRYFWIFIDPADYQIPAHRRVHAEDNHFFGGRSHPYDVGTGGGEQSAILRRDALFFGAAVARGLAVISADDEWALALQDWQAATVALALQTVGAPPTVGRLLLTLHNSYDNGAPLDDLWACGIDPGRCPPFQDGAETILNRALPLVDKPVLTVSDQFAVDLTNDDLQRDVLAAHLQPALRDVVTGVNNGAFAKLQVPARVIAAARADDRLPLRLWKLARKRDALTALASLHPSAERPVWGDLSEFLAANDAFPGDMNDETDEAAVASAESASVPWFVLAGRDDTRQKGFDAAAEAVRLFLADDAGEAQFLFFPIPGDEGRDGLRFLEKLATQYPRNVLVLPFLFTEGFQAALQAAAWGVMPSYYEPFGMANEFYLNGALGLARATGGLVQQIVPVRDAAGFANVEPLSARWHTANALPTGLLFRERADVVSARQDWAGLNAAGYLHAAEDRLSERRRFTLFNYMAEALRDGFGDAVRIAGEQYVTHYLPMLLAGIDHVQTFTWERTAEAYRQRIE